MTSLFVTGTDTDVGKTCITAGIVSYLSKMNVDVGVMKPFASGYKATGNSVSDGYELSNLKQQIIDLTGQTVYGTIPYQKSFNIESYVENFSNFIDISSFGFENI